MTNKHVAHLYGPLAGQLDLMPEGDADAAIAEGWATDPYSTERQPTDKILTQEESYELIEKANLGVAKLRGEEVVEIEPQAKGKDLDLRAARRASTAESSEGGGYKTRDSLKP